MPNFCGCSLLSVIFYEIGSLTIAFCLTAPIISLNYFLNASENANTEHHQRQLKRCNFL